MEAEKPGAVQQVIISVSRATDERVYDIEVPAGMSAGQLVSLIAQSMGWGIDAAGKPIRYQAEVHPHGRVLSDGETLAQAGVWDGAWLVLHPPAPVEGTPVPVPESRAKQPLMVRSQPIQAESAMPRWRRQNGR